MRTRFWQILMVVSAAVSVSACGTFDEIFKSGDEEIVVTNAHAGPYAPDASIAPPPSAPAPGQPYNGNFNPDNLMSVYNQISRGGVQMYDPAQGVPMVSGGYGGGVPAPQDSRVTVFPIEGGYLSDIQQGGGGFAGGTSYGSSYGTDAGRTGAPVYTPGNAQIYFKHGSSRLGSGDRQVLDKVADQARFSPVDRISVEGHASTRAATGDPVMDRVVNLKQSMDRTYAVSRELMLKGVPAEKIRATSWGDTRQPQGMTEEQARRVDIYTGGGY